MDTEAPAPLPAEIFARTKAAYSAVVLPPFARYTVDETFSRKGRTYALVCRVILRTSDGYADNEKVSGEKTASCGERGAHRAAVPLHPPLDLRPAKSGEATVPGETADEPKTIASVTVSSNPYDITYRGTYQIGDRQVYRLALKPVRDPDAHPIRALSVDTRTFLPVDIDVEAWAKVGPARTKLLVHVTFTTIEGMHVVNGFTTSGTIHFGPFMIGGDAEATVRELTFAQQPPEGFTAP